MTVIKSAKLRIASVETAGLDNSNPKDLFSKDIFSGVFGLDSFLHL